MQVDSKSALGSLTARYPDLNAFLGAIANSKDAPAAIARLWLTEGVPYSFKDCPGLYEALRGRLADQLGVHAKEITMVGSGRQGYALSPGKSLGTLFGEHSDLDMTAVSERLYQKLHEVFRKWEADYQGGIVSPRSPVQKSYWDENKRIAEIARAGGFIDAHKIPTLQQYVEARHVMATLEKEKQFLRISRGAPVVKRVSLRVYRNWECFIRQMVLNLNSIAKRTG